MRYLPMQRRCYQKFLRQNLQTLGELQLEKMLAERNGLGCEAKKNQKPPDAPAEEKEKSENPSGGVNSYLLLGIGGLVVSVLGVYYQREAIMTTLRQPPHPAKMLRLRQNQSQSPTQPQSSVNGLKFFSHNIFTTMADKKLVKSSFSTAMLYGLWRVIETLPNYQPNNFLMKRFTLSKIFLSTSRRCPRQGILFSHKYIRCLTTSSSKLFSVLQRLPA